MDGEPRKASEVLLELEKKMDIALGIIRSQDLSIRILSNKLNNVLDALAKQPAPAQKITVEAVNTIRPPTNIFQDPSKQIAISSEATLPVEDSPQGFRRTSRPETFAGDNAYLNQKPKQQEAKPIEPKYPVQIPKINRNPNAPPPGRDAEVVIPSAKKAATVQPVANKVQSVIQNAVPVMQRVVNSQGKSLFLADVEITDIGTMSLVSKTRTNGTGKWMASLGVGNYRVVIRKLEPASKQQLEVSQDIQVDGQTSPLDLQTIIVK
jgi:hypothetical protein